MVMWEDLNSPVASNFGTGDWLSLCMVLCVGFGLGGV